jgi:hypothetical protein
MDSYNFQPRTMLTEVSAHCTALHCKHYIVLHCTAFHCTANTILYSALHYSELLLWILLHSTQHYTC